MKSGIGQQGGHSRPGPEDDHPRFSSTLHLRGGPPEQLCGGPGIGRGGHPDPEEAVAQPAALFHKTKDGLLRNLRRGEKEQIGRAGLWLRGQAKRRCFRHAQIDGFARRRRDPGAAAAHRCQHQRYQAQV